MIEGFGRYRNYYRDALDKLGVTVNLMKVGTYKSFAEPYIGNGPSQAAIEADSLPVQRAVGRLHRPRWRRTASCRPARIDARHRRSCRSAWQRPAATPPRWRCDAKLVDGLKTRDEVRAMMIKRGAYDERHQVASARSRFDDYLARHPHKLFGDAVGVIVAAGDITDGSGGPGVVGGLSTANLIRQAREDDQIKALVLRVDSPGGSAYGSELIRRELELTRAAGKPVVVSMGNVAASGGYWISMASDEVIADPATITGSIGVFAILPTADKVVDKLGIHTAGVTTTWLADAYNPLRPLDPRFGQLVQSSINHIYNEFTTKAAAARKTTPEKIDAVGQGRVWTGAQAKERGLVDRLGSYRDALESAAAPRQAGRRLPRRLHRARRLDLRALPRTDRRVGRRRLVNDPGQARPAAGRHRERLAAGAVAGVAKDLAWLCGVARRQQAVRGRDALHVRLPVTHVDRVCNAM